MWLNAALAPPPPGGPEGGDDGGLAAKRLEARVRGALWHLYCGDPELIHVMTRVEKRIDEGFLRLKPEVPPTRSPLINTPDTPARHVPPTRCPSPSTK